MEIIAHRGASATAPENTLAAVEAAIAERADWVETDVQRTADGALVLLHDRDLRRTTNVAEVFPARAVDPIGTFTLAELKQLDAGSWFAPGFAGVRIPTLAELFGQRIGFLLEVKDPAAYPGIERELVDELRAAPLVGGRLVVQSFDHESVRRFAALDPALPLGLLTEARLPAAALEQAAAFAAQVNPAFTMADRAYVEEVHRLGMTMSVWTVDDERDVRAMAALGVDGLITDRPAAARAAAATSS